MRACLSKTSEPEPGEERAEEPRQSPASVRQVGPSSPSLSHSAAPEETDPGPARMKLALLCVCVLHLALVGAGLFGRSTFQGAQGRAPAPAPAPQSTGGSHRPRRLHGLRGSRISVTGKQ